jgi:hypothetical protein
MSSSIVIIVGSNCSDCWLNNEIRCKITKNVLYTQHFYEKSVLQTEHFCIKIVLQAEQMVCFSVFFDNIYRGSTALKKILTIN